METKNKSTKIPPNIAADVLYKSDLKCCVCKKEEVQIHHINGKNYDHRIDNLVCLCHSHHERASITNNLTRKLSKELIIKYREEHYQNINKVRNVESRKFDHAIPKLTEENLLTASKNALIIMEIERIRGEYYSIDRSNRKNILEQFYRYSKHTNPRLALDVFNFLTIIAAQTRSGMTTDVAKTVSAIIEEFYPRLYNLKNKKEYITLAKSCIRIGNNIAYDSLIHLRNLSVAVHGLFILKYIWRFAENNKITELKKEVNDTFDFLEYTLKRNERNDLEKAKELVKIFRNDLVKLDLSIPSMPPHIEKQIDIDAVS